MTTTEHGFGLSLDLERLSRHQLLALLDRLGVAAEDPGPSRPDTLVAVVVPRPGITPDTDEVRRFVAARLPAEYVPRRFVTVQRLPCLPNGKSDLHELNRLAAGSTDAGTGIPAGASAGRNEPETDTERWLAGVWRSLLRVDRVLTGDDFFDIGGNSLRAVRMLSYVEEVLGLRPKVRSIFDAPTLSAFARAVDALGAPIPDYAGRVAVAARVYAMDDDAVAEQLAGLGDWPAHLPAGPGQADDAVPGLPGSRSGI